MTRSKLSPGDPLPDADHVLRYVRKKFVDNDQIAGDAFLTRPPEKDDGPSVNWMEFFSGETTSQIAEIRKIKRMKYEKRGRVAKLNVGYTKKYLQQSAELAIDCLYDPLSALDDGTPADPSHTYLKGVPLLDSPEGEAVRDLLAHCIVESFPVVPD
jgi:hypothetical protein